MPAKAKSKPSKVRVGFIGSGGIARHYMGLFTKHMADDVEIVAISDSSEAALALAGDQFSIAKRFKNYKDMLKIKELDAVCVCTPNYLHAQPTIDALAAGKHVIVEKPMAMNATEAAAMVKAGKDNKRVLVIGFQYRYAPAAQVIKRAIDEGQFGKVLFALISAIARVKGSMMICETPCSPMASIFSSAVVRIFGGVWGVSTARGWSRKVSTTASPERSRAVLSSTDRMR